MRLRRFVSFVVTMSISLSLVPAAVSFAEDEFDPNWNSVKFDFGGVETEDGYIGVSADKAFTDDLAYGFIGITDKDYKFKNGSTMDGFTMLQGQKILLENGTGNGSGANSDFVTSVNGTEVTEPDDYYDYTTENPIRFSVAAQNGGYYHVKVTLANASATEMAKVSLFAERRHQLLTDAEIAAGGTLDYEFNVDVESFYMKSRSSTYVDDTISVEVTGKNAAIASMELTKLETGTTLWLMGDSTGCDQGCVLPYFALQNYAGTGQGLTKYLPESIALSNQGEGGINSGSKNHFNQLKLKAGDYLYAEWGHNESSTANYVSNMEKYYRTAVKAGAKFVVVGPIDRSGASQFTSSTGKWRSSLGSYSEAGENFVNRVLTDADYRTEIFAADSSTDYSALDWDNIAFVDINAGWIKFLDEQTERYETVTGKTNDFQSVKFYYKADQSGLVENSHENDAGADNAAYIFFTEAQKKVEAAKEAGATDADRAQAAALEGLVTDMRSNTPYSVPENVLKGGELTNKNVQNVYYPAIAKAEHDGEASTVKKVIIEDNKITGAVVKMEYPSDLTGAGITYALAVAEVDGTKTSTSLDTKYDVTNGEGTFTLTFAEPVLLGNDGEYKVWLQGLDDETQTVFEEDTYRFSNIFTPADVSEIDEYLIGDLDDIEIPDTFSYFGVKTGATIVGQNDWNAYPAGNANSTLEEDADDAEHATYLNISKTGNSTYYLYKPFSSSVSDGIIVFDADIYYGSGTVQFYYATRERYRNADYPYLDLFALSNNKLTASGGVSLDITPNTWAHVKCSLNYNDGTVTIEYGDHAAQSFTIDTLTTDIISEYSPVNLGNLAIYTGVAGELRLANLAVKKFVPSETVYKTVTAYVNDENGGTVTVNGEDGTAQVERGAQTVFKAEPADGYKFVSWTDAEDNEISTSSTYTLAKTYVNAALTANFESEYGEGYSVENVTGLSEDFEGESNIFGFTNKVVYTDTSSLTKAAAVVSTENIENSVFGNVLSISRDAIDKTASLEAPITLGKDDVVSISLDTFNGLFTNGNEAKKEYSFAILDKDGNEIASFKYYDLNTNITDVKIGGVTPSDFPAFVYSKTTSNTRGFNYFDFADSDYPGKVEFKIEGNGNVTVTFSKYNLGANSKVFTGKLTNDAITVKSIKISKDAEANRYVYHNSAIDNIKTLLITAPEKHSLSFTATDIYNDNTVDPTITVKDKDGNTVEDTTVLYGTYTYTAELTDYHTIEGTVTVKDKDETIELSMVPTNLRVVYLKDEDGNILDTKTGTDTVIYYPVMIEKDGVYYKTDANTTKQNGTVYNYGKYFAEAGTADIPYSVLENCVYYAEGETAITGGEAVDGTEFSNGKAKAAAEFETSVLPAGTYSVYAAGKNISSEGNASIYVNPHGKNSDNNKRVVVNKSKYEGGTVTQTISEAQCFDIKYANPTRLQLDYIYIVKIPNKYTVTWKNGDSTIETDENIEYNTAPSYNGAAPEKTPSDTTVYTFSGWKVANSNGEATGDLITTEQLANQKITADTTYLAQFTETTRKYKITFVDEDGSTVLKAETEYEYGAAVETPNNPEKTATEEYTYSFSGWSPAVTTVTGNQIYQATYTSTPVDYTVSKTNTEHGTITLSKETAHKGEEITVTLTPETGYRLASLTVKDEDKTSSVSNNQYTFTMPAYNVTVAATFEEIPADAYTITINSNITGGTVTTTPNGSATKGQVVTITATPDNGYQLKADSIKVNNGAVTVINNTFTMPEGNVTITAEFELKTYTITWMLDESTKIDDTTVDYNVTPTHVDASKAETDEYTYAFKGWTPTIVEATENTTYTAVFDSTKRKYTITWTINGAETSEELEYGTTPSHTDPTKAEDENGKYSFTGWSPAIETVSKAQTYTAQFDLIAKYTITYNTDDGTINDNNYATVYYEGEGATLPTNVTKDGYTFAGWYDNDEFSGGAVTTITAADTGAKTYYANWTLNAPTEYLITFVNWDNEVLQSGNVAVGETPSYKGETPTKAEDSRYTYEFSGWTHEIVPVSGIATYKAEFKQYVKPVSDIATIERVKDNGGVKLIVTPTQSELQTINLYAAIYNVDGSLKKVEMTPCNVSEDGKIIVPLTEPSLADGESYKLMLWDISQSPLITAISNSDNFFN